MRIRAVIKLWYDQAIIASFWAFIISLVIARTYLPLSEALKTTDAVLKETLPLIGLVSLPVAVLRILNRKRKMIAAPEPSQSHTYHYSGPECAECFEHDGSRECLGH